MLHNSRHDAMEDKGGVLETDNSNDSKKVMIQPKSV
jgi:hypothetical protein